MARMAPKFTLALAVVAATIFWSAPGLAQPQEFKIAPVGTRLHRDTGGWIEIQRIEGRTVLTRNSAGRETRGVGLFFPTGTEQGVSFDKERVESIWPLEVGKSVSFKFTRGGDVWDETIKVLRTERVTVPAGSFDAYVVEVHEKTVGFGGAYEGKFTNWYAPDAGFIVKQTYQWVRGNAPNFTPWMLQRIERPQG